MHQEVDYSRERDPDAKRRAAVSDVKKWLGARKFREVTEAFGREPAPVEEEKFAFLCGIAGIQGYPVKAWRETLWPEVRP